MATGELEWVVWDRENKCFVLEESRTWIRHLEPVGAMYERELDEGNTDCIKNKRDVFRNYAEEIMLLNNDIHEANAFEVFDGWDKIILKFYKI